MHCFYDNLEIKSKKELKRNKDEEKKETIDF